jgi:hypothetical protein
LLLIRADAEVIMLSFGVDRDAMRFEGVTRGGGVFSAKQRRSVREERSDGKQMDLGATGSESGRETVASVSFSSIRVPVQSGLGLGAAVDDEAGESTEAGHPCEIAAASLASASAFSTISFFSRADSLIDLSREARSVPIIACH